MSEIDAPPIHRGALIIKETTERNRKQALLLISVLSVYYYLFYWEKYNVYTELSALKKDFFTISKNKPYEDFESFYPFYLTQHSDLTCRRLHFIGTTIAVGLMLSDINVLMAIVTSLTLSLMTCHITRHYDYGHVEALVALFAFLSQLSRANKINKGLQLLFVGYGFAWIGHFVFEKNRPATFVYPTYSFFGDFKLWLSIATLKRPF